MINFLEYFWQAKSSVNHAQILLAAVRLVTQPPYNRSITILINIIRILFHGKKLVQEEIIKNLPHIFALLTNMFDFVNSNEDIMET